MFNIRLAVGFVAVYLVINVKTEECVYGDTGLCIEPCPPDTYSYNPGCDTTVMSQRTCRQPVARSIGEYCDYSRCDCSYPKVWDEAAMKCVQLSECSDQTNLPNDDIRI